MSAPGAIRRVPGMRKPTDSLTSRLVVLFFGLGSLLLPGVAAAGLALVGVSAVGAQRFENEDLGLYVPEEGDDFALAIAAGDFNGDGADDLATGIPRHDGLFAAPRTSCGIVVVRYGVPGAGLAEGLADTVLYQGLGDGPSRAEDFDHFGWALAAGDFDGDGFDDLAVGIPGDQFLYLNNVVNAGAVQVYHGSAAGLRTDESEYLHALLAWTENIEYFCEYDSFGWALEVGNFDGDAFDDLAIGAPNDCVDNSILRSAGRVFVAHGSAAGLLPLAGYGISENSFGIYGEASSGERFGSALAAGDFDGEGHDDLAIGVPDEGTNGALYVILGSQFGLIFANSVFWWPGALGLEPEAGDRLGAALAAGDFDGDGHDDLAIGVPGEDLGVSNEIVGAGELSVAYGSASGFDLARTENFTMGILFSDPSADRALRPLGETLAAGDFDGDGYGDLAVGRPASFQLDPPEPGEVVVLMGAPNAGLGSLVGVVAAGQSGVPGFTLGSQSFGDSLAVGDFDGDGASDLTVGVHGYAAGYEVVLYGLLSAVFSDGFESGSIARWSSASP